jgi:hypothetical protein
MSKGSWMWVDVDATLLDPSFNEEFQKRLGMWGEKRAVKWYNKQYRADLALNYEQIRNMAAHKRAGGHVGILTDRGPKQAEMTKENLRWANRLIDEYKFMEGGKKHMPAGSLPGTVYDDKPEFLKIGTEPGVQVKFPQKSRIMVPQPLPNIGRNIAKTNPTRTLANPAKAGSRVASFGNILVDAVKRIVTKL